MQQMEAEILFLDPHDVNPGIAALTQLDDDYGPTVWIMARIASELDPPRFLDWVASIIEPLGGDVVEAGNRAPPVFA